MWKIFRFLKKTSDQRKLRLLFAFPFVSDEIDQPTNFAKLLFSKMAFFDITVNFITQKLKKNPLSNLSFLWSEVLLREPEEIFSTYSRPKCDLD